MRGRTLFRRAAIGLFALVVVGDVAFVAGIILTREPAPQALSAQRIYLASRPAVAFILSEFDVTASIPRATVPKAKQDQITQQLVRLLESGRLADTSSAIDAAAINILVANPDAYLQPGSDRLTDEFTIEASGSGFFATQDGYLVTAAHVVSPKKEDILAEVLQLEQEPDSIQQARQDIQASVQRDLGISLNPSQLDRLTSWTQRWEQKYAVVDKVDPTYHVGFGTAIAGDSMSTTGLSATLVAQEAVPPGRDVAILKIDAGTVPALALAPGNPTAGSQTSVIGYPRSDYLAELSSGNDSVSATLTTGRTTDTQEMDGWTAYGTAAHITHGNSGGPVLDAQGRVLGIVSFGPTDSQGELLADHGGYFVPSSVIKQILAKASVKASAGSLTPDYYQALRKGDEHRYREELPILQSIQDSSSHQVYVKEDILSIQSAILNGKDQTPPKLVMYWPEAAGATGAAAILLLAVLLLTRRRPSRRSTARDATAEAAAQEPVLAGVAPAASDARPDSQSLH